MTKRTSGELKRLAREFLIEHYTTLIFATLITSFTPAIMLTPFTIGISAKWNLTTIISGIAAIIIEIIGQLFVIALIRIHLLLAKKQLVTLIDVFWAFRNHPDRYLLAALRMSGLMLLPAVPALICIIFIAEMKSILKYTVLAIVFIFLCIAELYLYYRYALIYPLYIENPEMTVPTGFRTSCALMRGNKARLFLLHLSFIGWYLLGLCSLGIGFLWIYPYILQTSTNFYLDLTGGFDKKAEHIDITIIDQVLST